MQAIFKMRSTKIALLVVSFSTMLLIGCSDSAPEGPAVGITRVVFEDVDRRAWSGNAPRPLVTTIWYPANDDATMMEIGVPPNKPVFIGGFAARDADLKNKGTKYPFVVLSHGTGGSGMQMMWLGSRLARHGYIVAAVDHHGNTAAEKKFDPRGFRMPWERAEDLSRVIDLVLADNKFGPAIDQSNISAVGFSLGGYTVVALAGGRTDLKKFEAFCKSTLRDNTCEKQSEFPEADEQFERLLEMDPSTQKLIGRHIIDFADSRVGRFVALAPALSQAFTEESLASINSAFLLIVGEADEVAPANTNASYLTKVIPSATLITIPNAGHYTFLNACNAKGRRFVPVCDDPPFVNRDAVHQQISDLIIEFLK